MLIQVGNCHLDPELVSFVGVQVDHDDKPHIVIVMVGFAHPLVHSGFEGSPIAEVMRIADLLRSSLDLIGEDRQDNRFYEDGVDMVRMPVSEQEDIKNTAYRAGWDDAIVERRKISLSKEKLGQICDLLSGKFTMESAMMRKFIEATYAAVAEDLGVTIKWEE
jgi:hypothetical protein